LSSEGGGHRYQTQQRKEIADEKFTKLRQARAVAGHPTAPGGGDCVCPTISMQQSAVPQSLQFVDPPPGPTFFYRNNIQKWFGNPTHLQTGFVNQHLVNFQSGPLFFFPASNRPPKRAARHGSRKVRPPLTHRCGICVVVNFSTELKHIHSESKHSCFPTSSSFLFNIAFFSRAQAITPCFLFFTIVPHNYALCPFTFFTF